MCLIHVGIVVALVCQSCYAQNELPGKFNKMDVAIFFVVVVVGVPACLVNLFDPSLLYLSVACQ